MVDWYLYWIKKLTVNWVRLGEKKSILGCGVTKSRHAEQ